MSLDAVPHQDLLSPEIAADPHEYYSALRDRDPMHWNDGARAWMLTRYSDVSEAYFDPRLSSDRIRPLVKLLRPERREQMAPILELIGDWMVTTDPPTHTRLRALANGAFRQQRIGAMSEWIAELVDGLLDDFIASGSDDFMAGVAYPLPAMVIARMMGVPASDRDKFQSWSDELALVAFGSGGEAREDRHARALAGLNEMQEYLRGLIAQAKADPGDDMISVLLEGDGEGDFLTDHELVSLASLLLFAGHETTTNLLCNALVTLSAHPDQMEMLREDPSLTNNAIEEILRYEGPIKILTRWVSEDHERHGKLVKENDTVLLVQQAANRDSTTFPDADTFDITRGTKPMHLGFGRGVHACLGAQLARLEARIALPKILERLPGLTVDPVRWKSTIAAHAVEGLTIGYDGLKKSR